MIQNIKFYRMYLSKPDYYANIKTNSYELPHKSFPCEGCGALNIKFTDPYPDIKLRIVGKRLADFYFETCFDKHIAIISENFIKTIESKELTGFEVKEREIEGQYDKRGRRIEGKIPPYKELVITGSGGHVMKNTGERMYCCPECGFISWHFCYGLTGLGVGDEWDGSDIFYWTNYNFPIVTEKFRNVIEASELKNIAFRDISDFHPGL